MNEQVARALLEVGAVGFAPHAPIRFKSGILSPVYVDNRILPYHPQAWRVVIAAFRHMIETSPIAYDVIAGVAVGGVPHSAALAYDLQMPSVFVRKQAKEHGKSQQVEGGRVDGKRVLLVEDLITTGGSSLAGVTALRAADAMVEHVLAIVTYGLPEAKAAFAEQQLQVLTLTTFSTILAVALATQRLQATEHAIICDWFDDPHTWAQRHSI